MSKNDFSWVKIKSTLAICWKAILFGGLVIKSYSFLMIDLTRNYFRRDKNL